MVHSFRLASQSFTPWHSKVLQRLYNKRRYRRAPTSLPLITGTNAALVAPEFAIMGFSWRKKELPFFSLRVCEYWLGLHGAESQHLPRSNEPELQHCRCAVKAINDAALFESQQQYSPQLYFSSPNPKEAKLLKHLEPPHLSLSSITLQYLFFRSPAFCVLSPPLPTLLFILEVYLSAQQLFFFFNSMFTTFRDIAVSH